MKVKCFQCATHGNGVRAKESRKCFYTELYSHYMTTKVARSKSAKLKNSFEVDNTTSPEKLGRIVRPSFKQMKGVFERPLSPISPLVRLSIFLTSVGLLAITFFWSYWPTLTELVASWNRIPDYSHGYLVVPFAIIFLWLRRAECPNLVLGLAWGGLLCLVLSVTLRYVGALYYLGSMDGWSILLWLAGTVWFLGGRALFRWSLPSIAFLFFMIPLPYGVERWLSLPLQRIATNLSCWVLQCLGQPAIAEGNTIWFNNFSLEVEQACSGLRIFVGILALAYVYLLFVRRSWWERIILLASVIPVSLAANCTRIVVTALLNQYVSGEAAKRFTHDFAGWVMIPFAAGLFGLVLWYLRALVYEEEEVDMRSILGMKKSR